MLQNFDYTSLLSALIGGLATLTAAVWSINKQHEAHRRLKLDDERKAAATKARAGFLKLNEMTNLIHNIKHHIEAAFSKSTDAGIDSSDAYSYVPTIVGDFFRTEKLASDEVSFLLTGTYHALADDVMLMQIRARNYPQLLETYNQRREQFDSWAMRIPNIASIFDGPVASGTIPEDMKAEFFYRTSSLNILLGAILEHIDEDLQFAAKTTQQYADACASLFSPEFEAIHYGPPPPPPTPPTSVDKPA